MKTPKSISTKKAIIESAENLFSQKDVKDVTVTQIAKEAGISKSTFYLYFESKDDIVWHFASAEVETALEFLKELDGIGYDEKDIDYLIDGMIRVVEGNQKLLRMTHSLKFYSFVDKDRLYNRYSDLFMEPIYEWFERGKRQNEIFVDNEKFAAYFFTLSVHEIIDRIIAGTLPFKKDEVTRQLKLLINKLLK